ncbi:MAG: MFS transporter, partial [Thermoplasmata archaeon]
SFYLMWVPTSHFLLNVILLLTYMLFFNFLFAYVITPYLALIPEISTDSRDRVRLTTIAAYFSIIGIIISSLIPAVLFSLRFSMAFVAAVMSLITLLSLLSVAIGINESENVSKIPAKYSLIQGIQQTFRNKTFNK